MRFDDRAEAGRQLARVLDDYRDASPIVVGLTRGGVAVAAPIATALDAPLDVLVVRKLGAPVQPELGIGAIAEGGGRWVDRRIAVLTGTSDEELAAVEARERAQMEQRIRRYRAVRPRLSVRDRTVIVVDDGIATGGTMRAAILSLRAEHPRKLVLAVPVAAISTLDSMRALVDDVVCVEPRHDLFAIGAWYRNFTQVEDEVVLSLLTRNRPRSPTPVSAPRSM